MTKYNISLLLAIVLILPLSAQEKDKQLSLGYLPGLAYNDHDGLYGGLAFGSTGNEEKRMSWIIAPAYGTRSRRLIGGFAFESDLGDMESVTIGIQGKSFSLFEGHYQKLMPYANLKVGVHSVKMNVHLIWEDSSSTNFYTAYQARLERKFNSENYPRSYGFALEYQNYKDPFDVSNAYLKLEGDYSSKFYYDNGGSFEFRVFGGGFIINDRRSSAAFNNELTRGSLSLVNEGSADQLYEGLFIGRNSFDGLESRSFSGGKGGFKNALGNAYRIAQSNNYMAGINLSAMAPLKIPKHIALKGYFDLALISTKAISNEDLKNKWFYSGGITLALFDEIIQFHLPIFSSDQFEEIYKRVDFFDRISVSFELNLWQSFDKYSFSIRK